MKLILILTAPNGAFSSAESDDNLRAIAAELVKFAAAQQISPSEVKLVIQYPGVHFHTEEQQ
jgi:hypothetical protein